MGNVKKMAQITVQSINKQKNYSTILLRATCHSRRNTTLFKVALQTRFHFALHGKMVADDRCRNGVILDR